MASVDVEIDHVMELFWYCFLTSAAFSVLVLIIVYWYLNYKY